MQRFVKMTRIAVIIIVMAALTVVYMSALYKLQIYDDGSDENDISNLSTTVREEPIIAPRGDILDRNGVPLITSVESYNITLSREELLNADDTNGTLLTLAHLAEDNGVKYTDTFPMTADAPFEYVEMDDEQAYRLSKYLEFFELKTDITASDLFVWMKDHYDLDYTTGILDARRVIGLRYEMELRVIINIDAYVFAEDAGIDFISLVKERGLVGVHEETAYTRKYNTQSAAHILGYIASMDGEQYEYYKALGYPMNALVGQSGVEQAFESYLHGVNGIKTVKTLSDGTVVDEKITEPVQPGQNVYISIDIGLQEKSESALKNTIAEINATRKTEDMVTGAALVITQVKTGQILTSVSYPDYDPATLLDNYDKLLAAENQPLYNRATQGLYMPGSTFKMVTGLSGLKTGFIERYTSYTDYGTYRAYADVGYEPECWINATTGGGHGTLDIVGAIQNSCNVFFWWVSDNIGIDAITNTASDLGLGVPTGIELPEEVGTQPTPQFKIDNNIDNGEWWAADTLNAAIGQGYGSYTPLQLSDYVATIANGGTRYSLTLLNKVKSPDYSAVTYRPDPVALNKVAGSEYLSIIREGMEAVTVGTGSAQPVFEDCDVKVGAKTGTAQLSTSDFNSGAFVCYAPADDPEIAIAIIVEKGTSGTTIMKTAREIVDYYFSEGAVSSTADEYTLLP